MWQWGVVSSLEALEFSIPRLLVQVQNPLFKVICVIQGAKLSDLSPTPNSAKAFFCLHGSFVSLWPQWAVQWTEKLGKSYAAISATFLSLLSPKLWLWAICEIWAYKNFLPFHPRTLALISKWSAKEEDALLVFYLLCIYIIYLTAHLNSSCTNSNFTVGFYQQLCWESTAQVSNCSSVRISAVHSPEASLCHAWAPLREPQPRRCWVCSAPSTCCEGWMHSSISVDFRCLGDGLQRKAA